MASFKTNRPTTVYPHEVFSVRRPGVIMAYDGTSVTLEMMMAANWLVKESYRHHNFWLVPVHNEPTHC